MGRYRAEYMGYNCGDPVLILETDILFDAVNALLASREDNPKVGHRLIEVISQWPPLGEVQIPS